MKWPNMGAPGLSPLTQILFLGKGEENASLTVRSSLKGCYSLVWGWLEGWFFIP